MPIALSTSASEPRPETLGDADLFARNAAALLAREGVDALAQYDRYPAPLYAVDADGDLLYYNDAWVAIAGRAPQIGIDRWCPCDAILTMAGEPVDQATGPMATVLRDAHPVRGVEALIERPDGERVAVKPYPTPALDDRDRVVGAVNLIVPLDGALHQELLATAQRCRTLAKWIGDRQANDALSRMAVECDEQALILAPPPAPAPARSRN